MSTLQRITALIKEKYKSLAEFERDLGLGKQTVSDWKRGKSETYMKMLPEIAKFLGTTTAYLLGETNDPLPKEKAPTDYEAWGDALRKIGAIRSDGSIDQERIDAFLEFEQMARKFGAKDGK